MFEQLRKFRERRYISGLVRNGLRLGTGVYLNDGFFLDPSHCHLITIEDEVVFGPGVKIFAHDASSKKVLGKTKIGLVVLKRNCFLGAGTIVLPNVTIGENSIIGAGSVVTTNIPPSELWAGIPARRLMSIEEYRNRLLQLGGSEFSSSEYSIEKLTPEMRAEMISALEKNGTAFMTSGDFPRRPA